MGPWVGGSLGQLGSGVLRCTGLKGLVQTCQLVVLTVTVRGQLARVSA